MLTKRSLWGPSGATPTCRNGVLWEPPSSNSGGPNGIREVGLERKSGNNSYTINGICVLAPDVAAGPYSWPRSETLRQNMTEDRTGVLLILDVGVMEMATCEPLFNALLAFWHCSATGSYFSFAATRQFVSDRVAVQRSNDSLPVFTDWVPHANGTIKTGNLNSAGQLLFDETVSQETMVLEPYVGYTEIDRTTDDVNSVFSSAWRSVTTRPPLLFPGMVRISPRTWSGIDTESGISLSGSETRGRGGGGGVDAALSGSQSAFPSGGTPSAMI
ncbi:protocatechuate 3 [Colletotrichum higginsianum]|nr:protocatechuate 3 [Colletotrichum higginsianum]